jgi:hypothetical protein
VAAGSGALRSGCSCSRVSQRARQICTSPVLSLAAGQQRTALLAAAPAFSRAWRQLRPGRRRRAQRRQQQAQAGRH